ncbi:putative NAD(P)H oxidase (H(2)O(2)-forming) [Helianthus annuus]|uniref:NAD(P)H oxidase (H(2)O(2)-forming) n=1 Tax=Helianthus annuus TaxID=4232 RepID=A0A9K3JI61_HELAN|nr:putative NAD(P)H oxidase (H(2)O(2)-forming) [Helianthus annuus]KAJ0601953.1 putative NAD(P)H oxidase (H(2)O(2)-forming) [Helianthus annuus]KAJ0768986.1 putative NAD(P)H oxidase (H(2)O(2)-forming) [Helianthus annuus]KAJ0774731.1 putative NAD(P)H oxidase (H(2)O(2)-forming) [Helianthus annuus]KAJ0936800.1 putative NAD(P)H oxidase (H(2)O(2)-forming) [Helianthus annuus]
MSKPSGFKYRSGQYIFLQCPSISPFECLPKLLLDGPYGALAQDDRNYDVLLLVGLGIGATPFISILRDLLNNNQTLEDQTDSNTETSISGDSLLSLASSTEKKKSRMAKSANFYRVTREPGSFEWFEGVMNEVAEMDQKANNILHTCLNLDGQIEMPNYLTSVYQEGDARSTLITMVQALTHAKHGVDILITWIFLL